ncbi:DUF4333 domain-containing protein [Gordonia sp. (in: high G+C Gram-positive bacteria)]|uniref:DUF4333 domain-containing protein n=1 Tax=Gordonia sp. (in: high G+C Gram-positive bacteria) TaxID=84139 RepID=UPI0039E6038F
MRTKIAAGVAALAIGVGAMAGCSVEKTVSQSELESKSKEVLQPKYNVPLNQVKCKGGLKAKAGSTQQCALEGGGQWQLLTATATDDSGKFTVNAIPGVVAQPEWAK